MLMKNHNIIILRYILYVVQISMVVSWQKMSWFTCALVSHCITSQYYTLLLLWFIIAFIIMVDPCFQGKTYGIWKLSDLGANTTNEFVALFLFGDVYKEHWKTTEGSVVALLNASILPAKEVSNWTHTFNRPGSMIKIHSWLRGWGV